MRISALGHAVLRVRDLARAESFYAELLGLPVCVRAPEWAMTFFTLGSHHDFAITANDDAAPGLDHVAFRLAGGLRDLAAAKARLEAAGLAVVALDHEVTKSLYTRDPDGNTVELYVDGSEGWRADAQAMLRPSRALELPPLAVEPEPADTGLSIVNAGPADASNLAPLVAAFRDHLEAKEPSDRELVERLPRLLVDPTLAFACARRAGEPVGYTQTRFLPSLWAGREAWLEDLYVLPSGRGAGVGRALLRHALSRARERGCALLGLTTNEHNLAAQALYRSEGLRLQGVKRWGSGREIRFVVELGAD
jgi:catechol 2,3-dioxygenase